MFFVSLRLIFYFFEIFYVQSSPPEVAVLGSISLRDKIKLMGKKSEDVYNSKLKSSCGLESSHRSLSKTFGYPSQTPNEFGGSSSHTHFMILDHSTGGKPPLHGPRRPVVPSRVMRDDFEIERGKFKVSKSYIDNYKAICSLASSP